MIKVEVKDSEIPNEITVTVTDNGIQQSFCFTSVGKVKGKWKNLIPKWMENKTVFKKVV